MQYMHTYARSSIIPEALAACGWHRDATCGAKDAPANINHSQVNKTQ